MLLEAYIAICLATIDKKDCDRTTATHYFAGVEQSEGYAGCMIHGMEFVTQSRLLKPGMYPKIWCKPVEQLPKNVG